jgi:hypothetical protein
MSKCPESVKNTKLNWIPSEFELYQILKLNKSELVTSTLKSTVRFRLPRNWNPGVNKLSDIKKIMFIVNSINNTWYHYHISRLMPDWLFVSLDLPYNGYDSNEFPNRGTKDSLNYDITNDYTSYTGDLSSCYEDIKFCYKYFKMEKAETVILYGYNIGALVALGFYNKCNYPNMDFKITHLMLNSPYLTIPKTSSRVLNRTLFNPLSYIFPKATQSGVIDKLYDSSATVAASTLSVALVGASIVSGGSSFVLAAGITVVGKGILNTISSSLPNTNLETLQYGAAGSTISESLYVKSQFKNFYIDAGTISLTTSSQSLSIGKSIYDIQENLKSSDIFINIPTLAIFSDTIIGQHEVLLSPGDSESSPGTADNCISLLNKMCYQLPITYKFSNMYNDALLSSDLSAMSQSIFSMFYWMQDNNIILQNDDGSQWNRLTTNDISNKIKQYLEEAIPNAINNNENVFFTKNAINILSNSEKNAINTRQQPLIIVRSIYKSPWQDESK